MCIIYNMKHKKYGDDKSNKTNIILTKKIQDLIQKTNISLIGNHLNKLNDSINKNII